MFEVFLPQLLLYPNPSDPLNGEAAALMMRDRGAYEQRVKGINVFPEVFNLGGIVSCGVAYSNTIFLIICL